MNEIVITCTTLAECRLHNGERICVVGRYEVWDPLPRRKRDHPPAQQVRLAFGSGEDGPFLGAWGRPGHLRALDEIARYAGKRVCVSGRFHSEMPSHPTDPSRAASFGGSCIDPVEEIAAAQ